MRNNKTSWDGAENFCQNEGGHLASVTNKEDQAYMLDRVGPTPVWIGATDRKGKESWEWSDCNLVNFTGWASGEPSKKDTENCVELYRTEHNLKGWNDLSCNTSLDFVCATTVCPGII